MKKTLIISFILFLLILIIGCKNDSVSPLDNPDDSSIILAYEKYVDIWLLNNHLQSINISENLVDTFYITEVSKFSSDGLRLIFTVDYYKQGISELIRSQRDDIFIYNIISKSLKRLTDNEKEELFPQFLPNSNEIVYLENVERANYSLKAIDIDNGNTRTIVPTIINAFYYPSISTDGMRITFNSFENGKMEIFIINADGSGLIKISNNTLSEYHPVFSPDGNHIYYYLYEDNEWFSPVIYKYEISTGKRTKLTTKTQALYEPIISSDNKLISCSYFDGSWLWVCLIDSSGNNMKIIGKGNYPAFTNDSKKIVYLDYSGIYEYSITDLTITKLIDRNAIWNIQLNPIYK